MVWESLNGRYEKQTASIRLQWKTKEEKDVSHFVIERSDDGRLFVQIGTVKATNTMAATYAFTDAVINRSQTVYYYRIKQMDNNGSSRYSPTITVSLSASNNYEVQIVPNPSKPGEARIRLLNSMNEVPASISVADASGKVVATKRLVLQSLSQAFMPDVPAGIYFIAVQMNGQISIFKVIAE